MADNPKSILILGAYGFIGSEITRKMLAGGHQVTGFGRNIAYAEDILPQARWVEGDLKKFCKAEKWLPLLKDIDILINASGVLQSGLSDDINVTQTDAIIALIEACERSGGAQFIQISACGASMDAKHDFMQSKARADQRLSQSSINATILRPGLVIGRNSYGGTELIRMVAAMPFIAPRLKGVGKIQCIALSELVETVQNAVERPDRLSGSYDLVEPASLSLDEIIAQHRNWLGFGKARYRLPVGRTLMGFASRISDLLGWLGWRSPMRSNAVQSLIDGVHGDAAQTKEILGRSALSLDQILGQQPAGKQDRIHALLTLALPLFLAMLIMLWLGSGLIGIFRVEAAAALLGGSSLSPGVVEIMVLGGAIADLILGVGLMLRKTVRTALVGTIIVTLVYLLGGAVLTPALWLDPLAPLVKAVVAMGLSIACLIALDKR